MSWSQAHWEVPLLAQRSNESTIDFQEPKVTLPCHISHPDVWNFQVCFRTQLPLFLFDSCIVLTTPSLSVWLCNMTGSEGRTSDTRDEAAVKKTRDLDLPPVARSPKTLPNELLLSIFIPFDKKQLKNIRCVCRLFARLVSPLLFDTIYISPHRADMDVFRKIAEHHDLCQYPRILIYDVQQFKENIDRQEYYSKLCRQMYSLLLWTSPASIQHVDKKIERLLRLARASYEPARYDPSEYRKLATCRIVQRGLELYSEKAKEQIHYNNNGELLASLCIGLMKLIHIDKVRFQYFWNDWHLWSIDWSKKPRDLRLASSPLARTWSPFYLQPSANVVDTPITHEFDNVIIACSLTGRPLRELEFHYPPGAYKPAHSKVACEIFQSKSSLSRILRQHGPCTLYHLECLTLSIDMRRCSQSTSVDSKFDDPKDKIVSVDLLAVALLHMPGLKILSLDGSMSDTGNGLMSISELFHPLTLPVLETLRISGMWGSATYIAAFLRARPRLLDLKLRAIELSEGTWAGLVDEFRRHLLLDFLNLELPLREDGGVDLWELDSWNILQMTRKIENYVLSGGENPLRAPRWSMST